MQSTSHSVVPERAKLLRIPSGLFRLTKFPLVYVGTPYTKFPGGIDHAFIEACVLSARLLKEKVNVYSPIVHCHPISKHGGLNPLDHSLWLEVDAAQMGKADALAAAMMPTWEDSYGLGQEIKAFRAANKPVFFVDPVTLEVFV